MEFSAPGRIGPLAAEKNDEIFSYHHSAVISSQAFRPGGRPISLLKGALGAAVALTAFSLSPGSAHAACDPASPANTCRVTVGGLQYDVTTFTGSYDNDTSKFATAANLGVMPWWGNSNLAGDFASEVGSAAGYPNGGFSPFFAYEIDQNQEIAVNYASAYIPGVFGGSYPTSNSFVYSQAVLYSTPAASVPGPLPLFGTAAAFGFSRQLRKRIQGSRLQVGSGQPRA